MTRWTLSDTAICTAAFLCLYAFVSFTATDAQYYQHRCEQAGYQCDK